MAKLKLILEIGAPAKDGGFETRREWQGLAEASDYMIRVAQLLEVAIWDALGRVSKVGGVGVGKTDEEARTKMNIDLDIRKAGEIPPPLPNEELPPQ